MESLREQFEYLALQYMDSIYKAALSMTGNETEAEDLMQDTYLRAYRFFGKFEKGTCMKAWLLKILKNTFINKFNKQSKEPEIMELGRFKLSEDKLAVYGNPEDDIIYRLFGNELMQAIYTIPEDFRDVVLLSDLEGFSYKEISNKLNCPIGTVMSRLYRGRKLLRSILREYAKELGYVYST